MGRSEARSAEIDRPAGVTRIIQVRLNKVEPSESVNRRDLFAKAYDRSSCFDEPKELWPKMPFVVERFAFAGRAEGLAGARPRPDFAVSPSRKIEGVVPYCNSAEEMRSFESFEVFWPNRLNWSLIYFSIRDNSRLNEFSHPSAFVGIIVIVIGPQLHARPFNHIPDSITPTKRIVPGSGVSADSDGST